MLLDTLSLAVLVLYRSWVVFSLGGCFPPSSLAIVEARYSARSTTPLLQKPTGVSPSILRHSRRVRLPELRVANAAGEPHISLFLRREIRFGLSRFRSPLITGSQLISLPPGTQMFPSPGFALLSERRSALRQLQRIELHSGIPGSKVACSYPGLIAACHALLRHPSQAIHHTASLRRMINIPGGCLREPYARQHRPRSEAAG